MVLLQETSTENNIVGSIIFSSHLFCSAWFYSGFENLWM